MMTYCLGCGVFVPHTVKDLMLCSDCLDSIRHFPQDTCVFSGVKKSTGYVTESMGFDGMEAFFVYSGIIEDLLIRFKYGKNRFALRTLRALLRSNTPRLADYIADYDILVTVPSHIFTTILRGYNPAVELCNHILPIRSGFALLGKSRFVPKSASMRAGQRKVLLKKNIFRLKSRAVDNIIGKSVLIFDDVMTTGTTVRSLARTLRKTGASKVGGLIFARNIGRNG